MSFAARVISLLSLASLLVALSSPCPPQPGAREAQLPHEQTHSHGEPHAEARAVLAAPCLCGCAARPHAAAGVVLELTHGLVSRAATLVAPRTLPLAPDLGAALPDPAIPPIDHVPLPA